MAPFVDIIIAALIVLGGAFALIGSWGLARLPNLMARLHGPTKATTLGVGGCLVAAMLYFPTHGMAFSMHELLVTLFLFITAPISANMVAKAYLHERMTAARDGTAPEPDLPPAYRMPLPEAASESCGWATFGAPEEAPQPDTTPRR
ncbi:Na+/H+ antiporter subunit G [Erythrobacter sp. T5W1-R]|uniref:Na+/H+ antiporter subunit G n=1 Tax=Erythrobacter sp. T5W1-R TaxID=3101752 RepID=UPI002AFF0C38|nr:Na+/H+ antiporter subunit G [Erythrobacter sp. T5W1-R]MEA1618575.1 Na+/H+ antiporter subunit G [Erythrobacter sp. T5W1-R]